MPSFGAVSYDARNFRVIRKDYNAGILTETRHAYFIDSWQVVEERLGSSTSPDRHFVWGQRYLDDLILRDRTTGGTLSERLYALQDANWNVTAVTNTSGSVQERYEYDPYGQTTVLTAAFGSRGTSSYGWETTYAGYRWDGNTGLFAVRNRYYNATLGTWVSRDPVAADSNLYQYSSSIPLTTVDPLGLFDFSRGYQDVEKAANFAGGWYQGVAQGGLNVLNGVQDAAIAIPNTAPLVYNGLVANVFGAPRAGYIKSPDWSRDMIVTNDPTHTASKFIGGQGAFTLCTLGLSQVGSASHLRHITSPSAASKIKSASPAIIRGSGGVYATGGGRVPGGVAGLITYPNRGAQVPITSAARGAFRPIPVVGPISGINRWGASGHWAPYGSVNLTTGGTTPLTGTGAWVPHVTDIVLGKGAQVTTQWQMGVLPGE